MNGLRVDAIKVLTDATQELVAAATEYLSVSRPLSEECEAAQSRMEQALSQFGGSDPFVMPEDYRGMAGRVRELEEDNAALSVELSDMRGRAGKAQEILDAVGAMYRDGRDVIEERVKERVAEMNAPKRRTRGASA